MSRVIPIAQIAEMTLFSLADNFDKYDAGLLSFIARGEGEEWRLVEVPADSTANQWSPAPGDSPSLPRPDSPT